MCGHHSRGRASASAGVSAAVSVTRRRSRGARVNGRSKVASSIRPLTVAVTSRSLALASVAPTSSSARSSAGASAVRTATSSSATSPETRSFTGRQIPIEASGGGGFQSTKPMVKSPGTGG